MPAQNYPNVFFKLVVTASAAFLLTVLLLVATTMSSTETPTSRFMDRNGLKLIGWEVAAVAVTGIAAMVADRKRVGDRAQQDVATSPVDDQGPHDQGTARFEDHVTSRRPSDDS